MNRLLIRLWGVLEGEHSKSVNFQIAETLISKTSTLKQTSSAALAKLCNVSKPTISRFSKELGYDDFYDFRADLSQYVPYRGMKYQMQGGDQPEACIDSYFDKLAKNLELMRSDRIKEQIKEICQDIHKYHHVYLLGNMHSGNNATNLCYNLHAVKKNIKAIADLERQMTFFDHIDPGALIVIFSASGEYFYELFSTSGNQFHSAGSKCWMITTNPMIKQIKGVDAILNCGTGMEIAGTNICLEAAANLIASYYWNVEINNPEI